MPMKSTVCVFFLLFGLGLTEAADIAVDFTSTELQEGEGLQIRVHSNADSDDTVFVNYRV